MAQAVFRISRSSDGQFYFNLVAANGEVVLTSERYAARASAENGIGSVQDNALNERRYERRTAKSDQQYFVLMAANGQVLGTSQMYSSRAAMEGGLEAVRLNAAGARVE